MAMHLEEIIEQTGGCGRYQVILSLFLHLTKTITCFSMVFMVFGGASPDWWCVDDAVNTVNISLHDLSTGLSSYKSCKFANGTQSCRNFVFADSVNSVINEWALVCDKAWVSSTITSVQMAGVFVGNVACGHAADLFGRKLPLYSGVFALMILNLIAIFSVSWVMFTVIRFFIGVGMGFQLTTMYSLQAEFTLARWRVWVVAVPSWAIELAMFALVAWLCKDWQYIHAVTAATGIPLLATFWFVPESFRWKVAHDRIEDANSIVRFVAKVNRKPVPDMRELQELAESIRKESTQTNDRKYTLIDILRNKALLTETMLLASVWISLGLGGYGIQFGVPSLSGNLYINIFIIAILGSPLQFLNIFLQNRFGRKKTALMLYLLFTASAALVGIGHRFEESATLNAVMSGSALISLTAINAAWSPVQTLTLETYPTVVRNIGYGTQNTMARVGAVIGPQLVYLDTKVAGMMYIVCAVVGVFSMLALLPLVETKDADLEDRIETEVTTSTSEEEDDDVKGLNDVTVKGF